MQESHGNNDIIIALAVIMMTPKHQTNLIFLPRWAKRSFSFLCRAYFFSQLVYVYVFTDLQQRIALWPNLLFPKCPILDCSILNPFSKCVFVLSRLFRKNQLIYPRKEALGFIHVCGPRKRKDAGEVLSLCCHQGRAHGLANLLNSSMSLKLCGWVDLLTRLQRC